MNSFIRGIGGGIGRVIGRIIGLLVVGVIGYFVLNSLDFNLWDFISTRILMNAKAQTQTRDMGNMIYSSSFSPCGLSYNKYCAQTNSQQTLTRNLNTTYNGVLFDITFTWQETGSYQTTITITAMSTDFRNTGFNCNVWGSTQQDSYGTLMSSASCSFISKSKIQVVIPQNAYSYHTIHIWGSPLTGVSTYGIKSIVESWDDGTQDTSAITDNATQNTVDIINNANQNTEDILSGIEGLITNQNCPIGPQPLPYDSWVDRKGAYLDSQGSVKTDNIGVNPNNLGISPYFIVKPSTEYKISLNNGSNSNYYYCWYRGNKTVISCSPLNSTNITTTSPSNSVYLRVTLFSWSSATLSGPICNDWEKELQEKANDIMSDDNIDDGLGFDFFNDFNDDNFGLASIITLPLTTIQSLSSSQCVALELPIPFTNGSSISLPCMAEIYQSKASGIYNLWQVVCYGLIGYWIGTDIFHMVKGFKDPDTDKVEVVDL